MRLALTKKTATKPRQVILVTTPEEAFLVRDVVFQEVLQERKRPVVSFYPDKVKFRFHPKYLLRLLNTFPHAERSAKIEKLAAGIETQEIPAEIPQMDIPGFIGELWDFQKVGVGRIVEDLELEGKSIYLNDEMGLGKTMQALAAAAYLDAFPALCVVPNSVKRVWATHLRDYFPMLTYSIVEGSRKERVEQLTSGADVTIINYEGLRTHCNFPRDEAHRVHPKLMEELDQDWKLIIADEFHRIKSMQAMQTKAFHKIRAEYKLLMSGTPMLNGRIEELYSPFHYCFPTKFTSEYLFLKRHTIQGRYGPVGYRHVGEIRGFLQKHQLRRRKDQVLTDLPPKVYATRYIDLTTEQRRLYKEIRDEMLLWLDDGTRKTVSNVLTKITRLKQACFSPELYGGSKTSGKIAEVKDIVAELTANGEKAIIFSQWSKATNILRRELQEYNPAYVDGKVPPAARQREIDRFQTDESCQLYIGTIRSNMEGITLTAASYVIFTDKGWTPAENEQAAARAHRIGQQRRVHIIELQAVDTIEERIEQLLAQKSRMNNAIVERDGGEQISRVTIQEIREIL